MNTKKSIDFGHFSLIATAWLRGSASEPTELQALPAELTCKQDSELDMREAEPRKQYVPRQEPGNETCCVGDQCLDSAAVQVTDSGADRKVSNWDSRGRGLRA